MNDTAYKSMLETTENTREPGDLPVHGGVTKYGMFCRSYIQRFPSEADRVNFNYIGTTDCITKI